MFGGTWKGTEDVQCAQDHSSELVASACQCSHIRHHSSEMFIDYSRCSHTIGAVMHVIHIHHRSSSVAVTHIIDIRSQSITQTTQTIYRGKERRGKQDRNTSFRAYAGHVCRSSFVDKAGGWRAYLCSVDTARKGYEGGVCWEMGFGGLLLYVCSGGVWVCGSRMSMCVVLYRQCGCYGEPVQYV